VRPAQADDAALPPFGEPEGAAPPAMTTLAPGSGRSEWRYDLAGDTAELAFDSDAGLERFDAIGIAAGVGISEHYGIKGDDPLSARQAMAWTLRRDRAPPRARSSTPGRPARGASRSPTVLPRRRRSPAAIASSNATLLCRRAAAAARSSISGGAAVCSRGTGVSTTPVDASIVIVMISSFF